MSYFYTTTHQTKSTHLKINYERAVFLKEIFAKLPKNFIDCTIVAKEGHRYTLSYLNFIKQYPKKTIKESFSLLVKKFLASFKQRSTEDIIKSLQEINNAANTEIDFFILDFIKRIIFFDDSYPIIELEKILKKAGV